MSEKIEVIEEEIDLMQLFSILLNKKKYILVSFFLSITISFIVLINLYPIKKIAEKEFFITYSGIESYKNPDGTNFSKEQIISPLILKNAYDKIKNEHKDLPFTYKYFSENLNIEEIIPEKIKENIDKERHTYYPNHFKLVMNRLNNSEIYNKILYKILTEYKKYFSDTYLKPLHFATLQKDLIVKEFDYFDLINIIKNNSKSLQIFIDSSLSNNNNNNNNINSKYFIECYNILSKNSLLSKKLDLTGVEIEQNYITKNDIFFIQKLKEEIKQKNLLKNIEKAKLDGANEILKNLSNIDNAGNSLNKESTFSLNSDFIEKQVQANYYSFLIKNILDYTVKYAELSAEIEFLNNKLNIWKSNSKKNNKELEKKKFEKLLFLLIDSHNDNIKNLNKILSKSFDEKYADAIRFSSSGSTYRNIFNKKVTTITLATGFCVFFISIFLILLCDYYKKYKKNRRNHE